MQSAAAHSSSMAVTLQSVSRSFGAFAALQPISLEIPKGQFIAILGPSGCGKSTLLRIVSGLDRPSSGTLNRDRPDGSGVAYVFQDAHLLPWRSVLANVVLPLELRRFPKRQRTAVAIETLKQVGLSDFLYHYPAELSGGMRMRVSLARALVTDPSLLLLDEPFAALDEITRQQLDEQLLALWRRRGMTVLFVTHSIMEAAFLAERAVVMSPCPGRVVLDRRLELPAERTAPLRGEPEFAREMRVLFEALEHGGPR